MPVHQSGELFEGLQPLPFELGLPVLKDTPCRVVVVPEQAESLFEQVRLVQPFVRLQQ